MHGRLLASGPRYRIARLLSIAALFTALPALAEIKAAGAAERAEQFVQALNAGDLKTLMAVTADPFLFRDQKWQSAQDGTGFVLGQVKDETVCGQKRRKEFFRRLVGAVRVKEPRGSPATYSAFEKEELSGADSKWTRLELVVFTRGFGDIEHIALVGIDLRSGKVAALYVN